MAEYVLYSGSVPLFSLLGKCSPSFKIGETLFYKINVKPKDTE